MVALVELLLVRAPALDSWVGGTAAGTTKCEVPVSWRTSHVLDFLATVCRYSVGIPTSWGATARCTVAQQCCCTPAMASGIPAQHFRTSCFWVCARWPNALCLAICQFLYSPHYHFETLLLLCLLLCLPLFVWTSPSCSWCYCSCCLRCRCCYYYNAGD